VTWLKRLVAGLSPLRPGFAPGSVHMRFVVSRVALVQSFLRVILFSPVNIIHCGSPYSYIIWGINNRPLGWPQFIDNVSRHQHEQPCLLVCMGVHFVPSPSRKNINWGCVRALWRQPWLWRQYFYPRRWHLRVLTSQYELGNKCIQKLSRECLKEDTTWKP
jgi:hypothetical protein